MILSLVTRVARVLKALVQNWCCNIFGERQGWVLQEGKMLNVKPVKLKGLSVLLKDFVLLF